MEAARRRLPNLAPSGRAGVRAMKGPVRVARAAGGADSMRLRSNLCAAKAFAPLARNPLPTPEVSTVCQAMAIRHPSRPAPKLGRGLLAGGDQGRPAQDVVLGDLDRLEPARAK